MVKQTKIWLLKFELLIDAWERCRSATSLRNKNERTDCRWLMNASETINQLYYPKHHLETSNRPSQQHESWKTLAEDRQVTGNESSSPTENTWILMMMMKMCDVQIRENHKHPSLLCDVETFIITEWRPWREHEHLSKCANLLKHCEKHIMTDSTWKHWVWCMCDDQTSALRRSLLCSACFISSDACVDDSKRISSVCW